MRHAFKCFTLVAVAAFFASCEKSYEQLDPQFPSLSDGQSVTISSGETVNVDFTLNDVRGNDIDIKIDDNAVEDYKISHSLKSGNDAGTITIAAPAKILDGTQFNVNVIFSDAANSRTASKTLKVTPKVKEYDPLAPQFPTLSDGQPVKIASGETLKLEFTLSDVRGNNITVSIDGEIAEGYMVSSELESGKDAGSVTIIAPALILDATAFSFDVTFSDAANNRTATKTIEVAPTVINGFVNITDAANTFIVAPGAYAQFPTLKGNSGQKAGAVSLALAWQDTKGLFAETVQVNEDNALVHFAAGKEGNAVINGLDATGKVVWSWLFWVIGDAPKDITVGGFAFMDRNIGAMNLDEKSELSVGLAYQYGRKDPFPGIQFGQYALRPVYDASDAEVEITIVNNTEEDNLENAIQNPTIYYNNKYYSGAKHGYSWITTDATVYGAEKFKALWDNDGKKTMYDPCPAGYKVASTAAWNAVKESSDVQELWDSDYTTFDESAIGSNEKYAPGNKKKVQFRGCVYGGVRLTITGELNSNSTEFSFNNCIGKPLPTAVVWCSEIDPSFNGSSASYFRGCTVKVNTSGNGNYDDISAIKVNPLTSAKYNLNYAFPTRCVKE